MGTSKFPSQERLKELFDYCESSGVLTWRKMKKGTVVGYEAGCRRSDGYVVVGVDGTQFLAHRLIHCMMTGVAPLRSEVIDHINGDPSDNRWANLRCVTQSENQMNRWGAARTSARTSSAQGVSRAHTDDGWVAHIEINGVQKRIGKFDSEREAEAAYLEEKLKCGKAPTYAPIRRHRPAARKATITARMEVGKMRAIHTLVTRFGISAQAIARTGLMSHKTVMKIVHHVSATESP